MFKPDMCVYHADCMDGFTAAYLVWKAYPDIEFVPVHHGTLPSIDPTDRNILMVDFAPKVRDLEFWRRAKALVILDHHKSAVEDLMTIPRFIGGEEVAEKALIRSDENVVAWFDMAFSGAGLTWKYLNGSSILPWFVELVQDRDLWNWAHEETKPFSVALSVVPKTFEEYDRLFIRWPILVEDGKSMQRYHDFVVYKLAEEAYLSRFAVGAPPTVYVVPLVNAPYQYASDLANHLLTLYPEAPFAACWFANGRGQFQFSLRSDDNREDVSMIARQFGGGGHRNAAGFEMSRISFTPAFIRNIEAETWYVEGPDNG